MSFSVIKADSVIFTSKPFAFALLESERGLRCDYCLKRNESLMRCCVCHSVYYCNKKCQRSGWKDCHKLECNLMIKILPFPHKTPELMIMIRTCLKLKDSSITKSEKVLNRMVHFSDFPSYETEFRKDERFMGETLFIIDIIQRLITSKNMPNMQNCFEIFCKIHYNLRTIYDTETTQNIGVGLYLGSVVPKHSCCPNATVNFVGRKLEYRAVKDILNPLENVTECYIGFKEPTPIRKALLRNLYFIECNCVRCQDDYVDWRMVFAFRALKHGESFADRMLVELPRVEQPRVEQPRVATARITELKDSEEDEASGKPSLKPGNVDKGKSGKNLQDVIEATPSSSIMATRKGLTSAVKIDDTELTELERKKVQLGIKLLEQQLKHESEKHEIQMQVEAQRLEAYERQGKAFKAEEVYWLQKRMREMLPSGFPMFNFASPFF